MPINVKYPSKSVIGSISPIVYEYLLRGFQKIGNVVIDKTIDKEFLIDVRPGYAVHHLVFYVAYNEHGYNRVVFDFSDFHFYYPELRKDDYYFKIHFLREYFEHDRMYPIGQTVGKMEYITHLDRLRKRVDERKYDKDLIAIYRTTNYDIRLKAINILRESGLNVVTGLKDFNPGKGRPYAPKEHVVRNLVPYIKHMQDLTTCKYLLALPAVDNSRAWKHTEAMGMGIPLLALDLKSILPGTYQDCYIKIKDDLSDLIEKIEYYNKHESERIAIGLRGREYFDEYLSPTGMATNIIRRIKTYD